MDEYIQASFDQCECGNYVLKGNECPCLVAKCSETTHHSEEIGGKTHESQEENSVNRG